jgi:hypothetical protein
MFFVKCGISFRLNPALFPLARMAPSSLPFDPLEVFYMMLPFQNLFEYSIQKKKKRLSREIIGKRQIFSMTGRICGVGGV